MAKKDSCSVVAIGKFEGLHLGHQQIVHRLMEVAESAGCVSCVLTFENNPLSVLKPEACPDPLMSPKQRRETLTELGVDQVVMLRFTREFANAAPEDFVKQYLVDQLHAKHVIVGSDFRYGKGAKGDTETLRQSGKKYGFRVEVISDVHDDAQRISSTRVRSAVQTGDVELAAALLGRPHRVRGVVVHGDARGHELGFPTANLGNEAGAELEGMIPADGVYAGRVSIAGQQYEAAISVGNNPTFTPHEKSRVEAHILDFDEDLYGKKIEVLFLYRVRGMEKFDSIEALLKRMAKDVEETRKLLQVK